MNDPIARIEYDRLDPVSDDTHFEECPAFDDEDYPCVCDQLRQEARADAAEAKYDAEKEG